MKKLTLLILIAGCSTTLPQPKSANDGWVIKGLVSQKQEKQLWCAAAVSRMMLSHYGETPNQCELAGKYHGENCCASDSVKCSKEVLAEDILSQYGLPVDVDHRPTFDKVFSLIQAGKPVAIYHYVGQGTQYASGHSVVAYWAYIADGKKLIRVYDPITDSTKTWDESYSVPHSNLAWYRAVWVK